MTVLFDIDINLRPEVLAFARLMELRLREKDAGKGQSWKEVDVDNLQVCAAAKVYAIDSTIMDGKAPVKHAIDLANYCMMIADVSGALECGASEDGGAGWAGLDQVQMS